MGKIILFDDQARSGLRDGVNTIANAVKVTLGPKGRNVIIDKDYGFPVMTKDGVTVASQVSSDDDVENMGIRMIQQVAGRAADKAGDGTTTATVLAQAMLEEGLKAISKKGTNPVEVKRGMDEATKVLVEFIRLLSTKVGDDQELLKNIATISANNEEVLGDIIAKAIAKVGRDGVVTVEESKTDKTYVEMVDGCQIPKGLISPYFITNQHKATCELNNPYILFTSHEVSMMNDIVPVLEKCLDQQRPLLIVAKDVVGEALGTLVVNKVQAGMRVCCVYAPDFGERQKENLEDLAVITGGSLISEETGIALKDVETPMLGQAEKVVVDKDTTTIIGGKGSEKKITTRSNELKSVLEATDNPVGQNNLKNRIARLEGGVAVLYVGATSEVEMREKRDRVDDALHATKAALEEGIVPGGGISLLRAVKYLYDKEVHPGDRGIGYSIVMNTLDAPFKQIVKNAGDDPSKVMKKLIDIKGKELSYGFNAKTGNYCDMIEEGIIDPAKVTRVAVESAVSVVGMLLTTECLLGIPAHERQKMPERNPFETNNI